MKCLLSFISLFLFPVLYLQAASAPTVKIEKSPDWKVNIPWDIENRDFSNSGEISYVLLDWQENEVINEVNYHFVVRLNNENGVQNNSQISVSFDPSYQQLAFNKIIIYRNNESFNHLKKNEIELLRNEQNAESLIYDGSYTALIILKDIRAGDVLEYEYTIKGSNPLFKGIIYSVIDQAYNEEVFHIYRSILVPTDKEVSIKTFHDGVPPREIKNGKTKQLVWDIRDCKAIFNDANIPSWLDIYPRCEVSSVKNWSEVKEMGRHLFPTEIISPEIDNFIRERKLDNSEKGILEAVRFVQNEVRYLGIVNGIHSHKPHQPKDVLKNRFGDCKDKSYLLVSILRKTGIEAWPAYVSTFEFNHAEDHLPSPFVFNHIIVKFRWNNKDFWIDPTISQQGGSLQYLSNPGYRKALVIDDKDSGFETIPYSENNTVKVKEDFWFSDSTSVVRYNVTTEYNGNIATQKRNFHVNTPLNESKENYLNFCSNYYDNLKWDENQSLTVTDDLEKNQLIVKESYLISDFWQHRGADSIELYCSVYPYNLYEYLSTTKDKSREMPLALYYPVETEVTINLHFPEYKKIGFSHTQDSIINKAFTFTRVASVNKANKIYTLKYNYISHDDHVKTEDLKSYFKDYDRLSGLCEENIEWGIQNNSDSKVFWPGIGISLVFITLFGFLLYRWIYRLDFGFVYTGKTPLAFGGWLIIPMIGLIISPFTLFYQLLNIGYFKSVTWESFIDSGTSGPVIMGLFFYFELLFNLSIIIFSIFLIVLLFKKRSTFPNLYIGFRIVVLVGLIVDYLMTGFLTETDINIYKQLGNAIMGVVIWVPYFLNSGRVKNTFVCGYNSSVANILPANQTEETSIATID